MATSTGHEDTAPDAAGGSYGPVDSVRPLALAAGLVLVGSYVSVLLEVTSVVGGSRALVTVVAASLVLATATARYLRPRHAGLVGVGLLVAGYVGYFTATPYGWLVLDNLGQAVADAVALLTGLSVLRMTDAGVWAVGFAPGPVFLSWYLLVRRRYAAGAAVGAAALSVFVLTNDAGGLVTLVGVAAAAATVGFGEIERRAGTVQQFDTLVVVVAAMVLVGGTISVVPTGSGQPLVPDRQPPTVEGGVVAADDRLKVVGSMRLTPEVRFVVESDEAAYWRVGAYDRYTGQGWVRSGQARPVDSTLPYPPGTTRRIEQTFTAQSGVGVMPAAWRPVAVSGPAGDRARVTSLGSLKPAGRLEEGATYRVTSRRPTATAEELRAAGTDYPPEIEERYTQLPSGTPDRVERFTDEVVAGADSPYGMAVRVERWLEHNKEYSLDVERPDDRIADSFLFEMERGYCTYYATTMVTMLRTQGIPARLVTGYATGQRVAEDRWVLRGLDSHAWVEVYFPGVGWIRFDPTPGGPRSAAERERVEEARENGEPDVDAAGSRDGRWTPTPDPGNGDPETTPDGTAGAGPDAPPTLTGSPPGRITPYPAGSGSAAGGSGPSRDLLGIGFLLALGAAAAIRRSGVADEAYRLARIQWQGARASPEADAVRAFERLEGLLARRYRDRRPGETRYTYLRALSARGLDERAHRVGELYHRARYGDGLTRAEADEAVKLVDRMVRESTPLLRRLR